MPQTAARAERIMTEAQAADFLGMTPRFLQARRHRNDGPPYVRLSQRCIKYRLSDLLGWLESNSISNRSSHKQSLTTRIS